MHPHFRHSATPSRTLATLTTVLAAFTVAACGSNTEPRPSGEFWTSTSASGTGSCEEPGNSHRTDTDLSETDFGVHAAIGRVKTTTPDTVFHFSVSENMFDACRDLSWIVLDGMNGDMARPAGTGASSNQVLVLFRQGELVIDPLPFEITTVDDVRRVDSGTLEVSFGDDLGATSAGVTETYDVTFSTGGKDDEDGGTSVSVDDTALPDVSFTRLDLLADPVATFAALNPMGNAHGSPYVDELPAGEYAVPVNDDLELRCDFLPDGANGVCQGVGDHTWTTTHGEEANSFRFGYLPTMISALTGNRGETARGDPLTTGEKTLVGQVVVDLTTPGTVHLRHGDQDLWVTPDDLGPEDARQYEFPPG